MAFCLRVVHPDLNILRAQGGAPHSQSTIGTGLLFFACTSDVCWFRQRGKLAHKVAGVVLAGNIASKIYPHPIRSDVFHEDLAGE